MKPIRKTLTFFAKLIKADSGVSSKRVVGIGCILFAIILTIYVVVVSTCGPNRPIQIHDSVLYAILQFLAAGTSLLGVTIFEHKHPDTSNKNGDDEYINS